MGRRLQPEMADAASVDLDSFNRLAETSSMYACFARSGLEAVLGGFTGDLGMIALTLARYV